MRKFSRFFILFSFAGLFTVCTPMVQADTQQGYGSKSAVPAAQADQSQHRSYGGKVGNKALNAFANLVSSPLEIPKNIINTTNKSNIIYGAVGGLFKGIVNTLGRIGVGVADLVTIPIPTKPIAQPVYIWDNFDVDTNYGPVFRLDSSPEAAEPPVVQTPAPQPVVVAPPPRPEPIDNSKQYSQETNRKLDSVFKKEMMK